MAGQTINSIRKEVKRPPIMRMAKCSLEYASACGTSRGPKLHRTALRRRSALVMTDTELKLMAAAAMMGESSQPNNG